MRKNRLNVLGMGRDGRSSGSTSDLFPFSQSVTGVSLIRSLVEVQHNWFFNFPRKKWMLRRAAWRKASLRHALTLNEQKKNVVGMCTLHIHSRDDSGMNHTKFPSFYFVLAKTFSSIAKVDSPWPIFYRNRDRLHKSSLFCSVVLFCQQYWGTLVCLVLLFPVIKVGCLASPLNQLLQVTLRTQYKNCPVYWRTLYNLIE